ncbi:hypothetical protein Tco_0245812 [Tanacetum coccineum]
MITFLKNVGRYTHGKLRNKKFEEVQVLYEKAKKSIQDFVPIGSAKDERLIEKMNKKEAGEDTSKKEKVLKEPDSTKMEVKQKEVEDSIRKRPGTILKMKARKKVRKHTHADSDASKKKKRSPRMKRMSKRKKTDSDLEEEEHLKTFLKIVPDEEGIVDYEVLEKRFPIINWESKFYHYDRHGAEGIYYRIFRSDGSSRWIKTFFEMVTRFDRLDLVELYNLVMQRFETTTPEVSTASTFVSTDSRVSTVSSVSTEDANQKFLRSLPASWSQVSLIMRTKPGVDSLSFDDLYNNLRVFEPDVKGSTGSSSST